MKSNYKIFSLWMIVIMFILHGSILSAQEINENASVPPYPQLISTGDLQADLENYQNALDFYQARKAEQVPAFGQNNATDELPGNNVDPLVPVFSAGQNGCLGMRDNTWTMVPRNDDGSLGPITLGFTFNLYGATYTEAYINTNGNITFLGPLSTYSPFGFPYAIPMVAPFWGDVDTRNSSCEAIYYKLYTDSIVVLFANVGYYNQHCTLINSFEVVLRAGTGLNNVSFHYGDMNWTTGDASGGTSGFGGSAATVGINKGDGVNYVQIGRFSQNNALYDGPGGNEDGVHYLDNKCYDFNVTGLSNNIPPVFSGIPIGTFNVTSGSPTTLNISAIGPEVGQNVTLSLNDGGLCGITSVITNGANATIQLTITPMACNLGSQSITIKAVDNGVPSDSSSITIPLYIDQPCPITNNFGPIWINSYYKAAGANDPQTYYWGLSYGVIVAKPTGGVAPYTYNWYSGAGYTIKNPTSRRPRLWYPTGPQWVYVDITDANNCTITDSIYIDWVDYTCNQPLIWWYELCDVNTGSSTCVSTTVAMRNLVKTGNYVYCGATSMPSKSSIAENQNINLDMGISVFPNPSNGAFTLIVSNAKNKYYNVRVFDLNGRLLHLSEINTADDYKAQEINLNNLAAGMYMLQVTNGTERAIERIVIQ